MLLCDWVRGWPPSRVEELGRSLKFVDLLAQPARWSICERASRSIAECGEHVDKQLAANVEQTMREIAKWSREKPQTSEDEHSAEPKIEGWRCGLKQIDEKEGKSRMPDDRHSTACARSMLNVKQRMEQARRYGGPNGATLLQDAVNDYSLRYSPGYIAQTRSIRKDSTQTFTST